MILLDGLATTNFGAEIRLIEDVAEVEAMRLPVIDGGLRLETIGTANHFVDFTEAELGHDFTQLRRDKAHEVHDMLGLAGETLAQPGILSGDTRGAGIQMADPHHDATDRHQRRRRKTELLSAEQRGDRHIAPRLQLTVRFDDDATA